MLDLSKEYEAEIDASEDVFAIQAQEEFDAVAQQELDAIVLAEAWAYI